MPLLVIDGLTKSFKGTRAINAVSFAIEPGEILGLLGPNGAGKTTTLRCIADLIQPDTGTVTLQRGPASQPGDAKIGFVSEEPALFPQLSVWEHLGFVVRLHRLREWESRAAFLLESFGIQDCRDRVATTLSLGQRRKVALAMTLIADSAILVLDEPFNGLDPESQIEFRNQLGALRDENKAILLSTHRLDEAELLADRFVILRNGEVAAAGTLLQLRASLPGSASLEEIYLSTSQATEQ